MVQVTVILEHMFHPSEMEEEATLREDLEDDIKTECTKMGPVEKVARPQSEYKAPFQSLFVLPRQSGGHNGLAHNVCV